MSPQKSNYRWYLLALILITDIVIVAMPMMAISVLSKDISNDLHLNVVQVGILWGMGSLPAIITSLLGGSLGDKFGPKKMMIVSTLLAGLLGAARGIVPSYALLLVVVVLLGCLIPFVFLNGIKTIGQWFPESQMGLANGFISMSMALGLFLGSFLSASILSPWLGGWRQVFIFYGLIGAFISIPWILSRSVPTPTRGEESSISMSKGINHVIRLKNVWLIGLVMFFMNGAVQAVMGYLPLYLRSVGWAGTRADATLATYNLVSMIFVLPIALWSDRLGSRKKIMVIGGFMAIIGFALMSIAKNNSVWVAVVLAGFMRDGFMAMLFTSVIESKGVGPAYAGTATGFVNGLGGIGMTVEPVLGNSLALYWAGAPFMLWAGSALAAVVLIFFLKGKRKSMIEHVEMENVPA